MKRFALFVAMTIVVFAVKAQDIIVMRNAAEIKAKVVAITPETISYKRSSNPNGPTYTIFRSEVSYIIYQNGERELVTEMPTPVRTYKPQPHKISKPTLTPIKFSGHVLVGNLFGKYWSKAMPTRFMAGPAVDVSLGMSIYEYFYMGVESGFHTAFYTHVQRPELYLGFVPIGANIKVFFTRKNRVNPYATFSFGGYIGVSKESDGINGTNIQIGLGLEVSRFSFGVGYSGLSKNHMGIEGGYVKLGIIF